MIVLGALGAAFFARHWRKNDDHNEENILSVSMVCGVLTGLNGGGLLAIFNAAFAFEPLARLGIIIAAVVGLSALIKVFWRMFGVHKLVYQPPVNARSSELGLTKESEPDQRQAA